MEQLINISRKKSVIINPDKIKTYKKEQLENECSVYNKEHKKKKFHVHCPVDVISGNLITKEKRHKLFGKVSGGSGSRKPEEFQLKKIVEGTGIECIKTNIRINLRTNKLKDIVRPNTKIDGFDYSENFDGVQCINDKKIYINLKCIVGKGGVQTRSLREVYLFLEGQLNVLKSVENICFANILDGDESHTNMSKFEYIIGLPTFDGVKNRVYIGDLRGYFYWFMKTFEDK